METLVFEGTLTALTPIFSGGDEKTGTETLLRRIKFIVGDEPVEVPFISGNSIRGVLRRLLFQDFFKRVGYEIKSTKLFYLFSGGALEEAAEEEAGVLDLQLRRMIRSSLPPLSLLGGAIANQTFSGKLTVGMALPVCRELNDFLPVKSNLSFYDYLTFTFATRHAERDMPESVQEKPPRGQEKAEPTVQMMYNIECFAPGTKFYHKFTLMDATPIEKSCFAWMIELWRQRPILGGKSAIGYGQVLIDYPTITFPVEPYLSFLEERRDEIVKALEKLDKL
ncbi:MAG: hypothetical protein QXT28_07025 [Thermofilaceae archaeon]